MQIIDKLMFCIYCGNTSKALTKEQAKIFGKPTCCGYAMLEMDLSKLHTIVKNLDKLKKNLEEEILRGME